MVLRCIARGNGTLDNRRHFSCCRGFGDANADGAVYRYSDHLLGPARMLGHHLHTVGLFSLALAFVPFEIEEQVHRGLFLQKELGKAGEEACRKWRDETRARIEARWGFYSSQLKAFDNTHGVSITLPRRADHLEVRMMQELEALQTLDPARPLFRGKNK